MSSRSGGVAPASTAPEEANTKDRTPARRAASTALNVPRTLVPKSRSGRATESATPGRAEVNDGLGSCGGAPHRRLVLDPPLDAARTGSLPPPVRAGPRGEVVEDGHLVPALEQEPDEVGSHEPRPSC